MNDLDSRIATIERKVNWAKKLSKRRTNPISPFRSADGLEFNPPIELEKLIEIESQYEIKFPEEYIAFLVLMRYTLVRISSEFEVRSSKFGVRSSENLVSHLFETGYRAFITNIANGGCGYYDRLVVTGTTRGQIWGDGECTDQGYRPFNLSFFDWYEPWLDKYFCLKQ